MTNDDGCTGNHFEPSDEVGCVSVIGREEDLVVEDVFGEGIEIAELEESYNQEKQSKSDAQQMEEKGLASGHGADATKGRAGEQTRRIFLGKEEKTAFRARRLGLRLLLPGAAECGLVNPVRTET